jgi:predicted methyltransferase
MKLAVCLLACSRLVLAQPMPANIPLKAILADERERDQREKIPDLVQALHLVPGSIVADLGTGYGYYAARFSRIVGPQGRVYAEEIDAPLLDKVRQRMNAEKLTNVEFRLGTPDDPKFPTGALDAVIISDVYHEVEHPALLLAAVRKALKPGGLLLVVDYLKPEMHGKPREDQVKVHNIAPEFLEADLKAAGFAIVDRRDPYAPGYDGIPTYYLLARSPRQP